MRGIIEFSGPVLTGPDQERQGLWAVDGLLTFSRPAAPPDAVLDGWVLPGLVDAHCHIGLGPGGDVPDTVAEEQAVTDRDAGTLLVRDAGAVHDTRWIHQRPELPRIIRAGRHIARSRRYLRGLAVEVEPDGLVEAVRNKPGPVMAGSSSWGTGSTGTPATSRRLSPPPQCGTLSVPRTMRGPG
jgi:imidazolonepropionase-like amidohydrolase